MTVRPPARFMFAPDAGGRASPRNPASPATARARPVSSRAGPATLSRWGIAGASKRTSSLGGPGACSMSPRILRSQRLPGRHRPYLTPRMSAPDAVSISDATARAVVAQSPCSAGWWWWRPRPESQWTTRRVQSRSARRFSPAVRFLCAEIGDGHRMATHAGSYAARDCDRPFCGEWSGPISPPTQQ